MNKFFTLLFFLLFGFSVFGQGIINDGAFLVVSPSTAVTISGSTGHFTNQNSATTKVEGDLLLQGNFINNATFNPASGRVTFNGSAIQSLNGSTSPTSFYDLTENNINGMSVGISLVNIENQLTMTQGLINLNSNEITLGTSTANPGTLSLTAGWMHGAGKFTRWFATSTVGIGTATGLFPMGSATYYHPLWFGTAVSLTNGGTLSLTHNPSAPGYTTITQYTDVSWGNDVIARSQSAWNITAANLFNVDADYGMLRFGGYGFATFNQSDVNASLATTTAGDYVAPTNVVPGVYFEVNRTTLQTADIDNTWYIGTRDVQNTPLPVELITFTGNCNFAKVTLNWSTASETNNSMFAVERSFDGIEWETIGEIPGAGNSNQVIEYSFTDEDAFDFTVYYRLRQTDFDGKVSHFAPLYMNCSSDASDNEVTVYPNPFKDEITLIVQHVSDKQVGLNVYDMLGNLIVGRTLTHAGNQNFETALDLSAVANGVYFVEVRTAGFTRNIKIVKN